MNRSSMAGAEFEGHMQHLDEGTIHAWLDGALAEGEATVVAAHVAECRDCAALVAEARGMIAAAGNIVSALDTVRGGVIPMSAPTGAGQHSLWRRLRLTPARAALAATLLIAVASLLSVRRGREGIVGDTVAQARTEAAPTTVPARKSAASVATASHDSGVRVRDAVIEARSPKSVKVKTMANAPASAPRPRADTVTKLAGDQVFSRPVVASGASPASSNGQPAAAPPAAKTMTDAVEARVARRAEVAPQAQQAVAGGVARSSLKSLAAMSELEGCYQVRSDSGAPTTSSGVPARFALVNVSGGPPHAVRAISPEGRIDSIVPGGTWQRLTPDMIQVSFANARQPSALTLRVASGFASQSDVGNQAASLPVTRIDCRR
jgi:hypothetical protein